jgi:hypothetical protein
VPSLHTAAAAALSAARRAGGVAITIRRGSSEEPATATLAKTVFTDKSDGSSTRALQRVETRDYMLPAAEYLVDGDPATPAAGDQIVQAGRTYEVVSVNGEPCYRSADPGDVWLRVHTTLVDY